MKQLKGKQERQEVTPVLVWKLLVKAVVYKWINFQFLKGTLSNDTQCYVRNKKCEYY